MAQHKQSGFEGIITVWYQDLARLIVDRYMLDYTRYQRSLMLDWVEEITSGRNGTTGKIHSIESGGIGPHSPMDRQAKICDICSFGNNGYESFLALFNRFMWSPDTRSNMALVSCLRREGKRPQLLHSGIPSDDAYEHHVVSCVRYFASNSAFPCSKPAV
jgi:hypothetical protein